MSPPRGPAALPSDGSLFPAVRRSFPPFLRFPLFSCFSASCVLRFTHPCGSSPGGQAFPGSLLSSWRGAAAQPCLWSALNEAAALQGGSDRRRACVVARAVQGETRPQSSAVHTQALRQSPIMGFLQLPGPVLSRQLGQSPAELALMSGARLVHLCILPSEHVSACPGQ